MSLISMKCPNCDAELAEATYRGIEVNKCPQCRGTWFEVAEVDQLEDQIMSEDEFKNTMITDVRPSHKKCPDCSKEMSEFEYRWEDSLNLDYCPEGHGIWLEQGEEEKVLKVMDQHRNDALKIQELESSWDIAARRFESKTWLEMVKERIGLRSQT